MRLKTLTLILFIPFFLCVQQSLSNSSPYSDQDCLFCHGKPDIAQITSDGKVRSIFVDPEKWSQDMHHKGKVLCVDCHTHANPYVHFREGFIDVDCARCHPEEAEEYQKNIHLTFAAPSAGKELPLCFHCHTRHHVLRHDDPASSVHERNIGETCGKCHAEVMVKGIINGSSIGKISGHRKGDISERFDMEVCINCHYDDSAHGAKRVYKDFCSRCHDVRVMANFMMGPTHLNSQRVTRLNHLSSALVLSLVIGVCVFFGYRSRGTIIHGVKSWFERMKIEEDIQKEESAEEKERKETEPEPQPEQIPDKAKKEDIEQKQETAEEHKPEEKIEKEGDQNSKQEGAEGEHAEKEEQAQEKTKEHEDKGDGGQREP